MTFQNHNNVFGVSLLLLLTSQSVLAQPKDTTYPSEPWAARDPIDQRAINVTDGILLNDTFNTPAFGVPRYDFSDEDGTVQVYRFLGADETVPAEYRVSCEMQCTSAFQVAENLFLKEGDRPINANNYSVAKTDDCPIENVNLVMNKTQPMWVYATSVAFNGIETGQIKCIMEAPLTITAIAEEDKTTDPVSVPTFDEDDQQNTLALWRFTTGDIPKGTTVTCTLFCDNTVVDVLETIALKANSRPIDFEDHDKMIEGICPIAATWQMKAKDQLYIMANSKEAVGLRNARISCDANPDLPSPTPSPGGHICYPAVFLKNAYNRIVNYIQSNREEP